MHPAHDTGAYDDSNTAGQGRVPEADFHQNQTQQSAPPPTAGRSFRAVREVSDRPVLWKELRAPLLASRKQEWILAIAIVAALAMTYWATSKYLYSEAAHITYTLVFLLINLMAVSVLAATTITSEKEASTWDALMTTALSGREILFGKVLGVLRRLLPVGALFLGHVMLFTVIGVIHPLGIFHTFLLLGGPTVFLAGTGIYFSLRAKRTTTAVMLNVGLALFLWLMLPILMALIDDALLRGGDDLIEAAMIFNPMVLDALAFDALTKNKWMQPLAFDGPTGDLDGWQFTGILLLVNLLYAGVGLAIIAWCARRFRRFARG